MHDPDKFLAFTTPNDGLLPTERHCRMILVIIERPPEGPRIIMILPISTAAVKTLEPHAPHFTIEELPPNLRRCIMDFEIEQSQRILVRCILNSKTPAGLFEILTGKPTIQ